MCSSVKRNMSIFENEFSSILLGPGSGPARPNWAGPGQGPGPGLDPPGPARARLGPGSGPGPALARLGPGPAQAWPEFQKIINNIWAYDICHLNSLDPWVQSVSDNQL